MCAALLAVVVVGALARRAPGVCGVYHDDAIYVACGEALATGEGYRLTRVPGAPPQTKYPFVYPAMVAGIWRLWPQFPDNLLVIQGLSVICGWAALACGYLYMVDRGYCSRRIAIPAAVLTGTSASYLYFCTTSMSEMPFSLAVFAVLWTSERRLGRRNDAADVGAARPSLGRAEGVALGALASLPYLIRSVGVVVPPAILWFAYRRGYEVRWLAVGSAIAAAPWTLWSLAITRFSDPTLTGYYTDYLEGWYSGNLTAIWRTNILYLAHGAGFLSFEGLMTAASDRLRNSWWPLVIVAGGAGAWWSALRGCLQGRLLPAFLALYAGALMAWSWPPLRFLTPIQIVLAAYLMTALWTLVARLQSGDGKFVRIAMSGVVAAGVVANARLVAFHRDVVRRHSYPIFHPDDQTVDWRQYENVFAWLREHAKPTDRIACGFDSMISLYTGLPAMRPYAYRPANLFYGADPSAWLTPNELVGRLEAIAPRYVIDMPMPGFAEYEPFRRTLQAVAAEHDKWLAPVFVGEDNRFVIYRIEAQEASAMAHVTRAAGEGSDPTM